MKVLGSRFDEVSSDTAVTAEALACGGGFALNSLAGGHSVELPSLSAVGDPALLTVGWSDPNSGRFVAVNDEQRPFGFERSDVFVGDYFGSDWVNDGQLGFFENQLWLEPEQNGADRDHDTKSHIEEQVAVGSRVSNGLKNEGGVKSESYDTPDQVAFWAKDSGSFHTSIIADELAGKKGKQK
jgi:hypothetical protein